MKKMKSTWRAAGASMFFIGIAFLSVYAIAFIVNDFAPSDTMLTIRTIGVVWIALSLPFNLYSMYLSKKLRRLKRDGVSFDAKILEIVPMPRNIVQISNYITAYVRCNYESEEGEVRNIKSRYLLMSPGVNENSLSATVYVDFYNPYDYAIEVKTCKS